MNPSLAAFDPTCRDCRHGESHHHVRQTYEAGRGLVTEFEPVYPPDEISEARAAWRDYKAGFTRRPRKGDLFAIPTFFQAHEPNVNLQRPTLEVGNRALEQGRKRTFTGRNPILATNKRP